MFFVMVIWSIVEHLCRLTSFAILVMIALMFLVLSCHGESLQFNQGFGYHLAPDLCEEHIIQSGDLHTDKSIFDGVSIPSWKVLIVAIFIAAIFTIFPKLSERYSRLARIAIDYHQRKRWVWARHTPFSSSTFFPYFAATRDH